MLLLGLCDIKCVNDGVVVGGNVGFDVFCPPPARFFYGLLVVLGGVFLVVKLFIF